jgi:hypothetical protein
MLNFVLIHGSWHTGAHWTRSWDVCTKRAVRLSHRRSSVMEKV